MKNQVKDFFLNTFLIAGVAVLAIPAFSPFFSFEPSLRASFQRGLNKDSSTSDQIVKRSNKKEIEMKKNPGSMSSKSDRSIASLPSQTLIAQQIFNTESKPKDAHKLIKAIKKSSSPFQEEVLGETRSLVMMLDCNLKNEVVIDARFLRLKSKNIQCFKEGLRSAKIENRTNGFTGSVLYFNSGFTTDFIELSEGSNEIYFSAVDNKGRELAQTVRILRRTLNKISDNN